MTVRSTLNAFAPNGHVSKTYLRFIRLRSIENENRDRINRTQIPTRIRGRQKMCAVTFERCLCSKSNPTPGRKFLPGLGVDQKCAQRHLTVRKRVIVFKSERAKEDRGERSWGGCRGSQHPYGRMCPPWSRQRVRECHLGPPRGRIWWIVCD